MSKYDQLFFLSGIALSVVAFIFLYCMKAGRRKNGSVVLLLFLSGVMSCECESSDIALDVRVRYPEGFTKYGELDLDNLYPDPTMRYIAIIKLPYGMYVRYSNLNHHLKYWVEGFMAGLSTSHVHEASSLIERTDTLLRQKREE